MRPYPVPVRRTRYRGEQRRVKIPGRHGHGVVIALGSHYAALYVYNRHGVSFAVTMTKASFARIERETRGWRRGR